MYLVDEPVEHAYIQISGRGRDREGIGLPWKVVASLPPFDISIALCVQVEAPQ